MKIYSMTATFGKLEHQTLTLKPGLNVIQAPNEWGKSTWCAFLIAMLYGIDTRARTTQTALADKERYAPWSGAPMEGSMDICWNGRDITIQRRTRGRLILGDFRAFETDTGLDVPELTASNCGMVLLGVEQSVFLRAGFLKMSDLPVTQDDALRRRLNNLVTTGDESGAGEKLAQSLKDLKNKCRSNRSTGLLPQAEAERDRLEEQLRSLQDLNSQASRLRERQQELETRIDQLQNHKAALHYSQAQEESRHIRDAEKERDSAQALVEELTSICHDLPREEEAEHARMQIQRLHSESMALQMEQQMMPPAPTAPQAVKGFEGLTGAEAVEKADADTAQAEKSEKSAKTGTVLAWIGIVLAILGGAAAVFLLPLVAISAVGLVLFIIGLAQKKQCRNTLSRLAAQYETADWKGAARNYAEGRQAYDEAVAQYSKTIRELESRRNSLISQIQELTGERSVADSLAYWEDVTRKWRRLGDARRDLQRAESQIVTWQAMAKDVPAPEKPDTLTYSLSETDALLRSAEFEQQQNNNRLGQYQGQADALGQESAMREDLKQIRQRIAKLEDTYAALELAQTALSKATGELQRRFAPRIAKRAQELFEKLTGGRYQKVMLAEDLSLHVSAQGEGTLRTSQWRSDGTVDQLYLALRLAVAEELTPEAPLILDDAMVRFDDDRLATALHILEETAENKQVILFTCQGREKKLQGEGQ